MWDVEFAGEGGGREHRYDGHPVHVVGDRFAGGDAEAAPAFSFGGFKTLEEVEEGDGSGGGGWGWDGESGEDCGFLALVLVKAYGVGRVLYT